MLAFGMATHGRFIDRHQVAMFAAKAVAALAFEAVMGKKFDVVAGLAVLGQIGQDLTDDAAKFEAVTGAS